MWRASTKANPCITPIPEMRNTCCIAYPINPPKRSNLLSFLVYLSLEHVERRAKHEKDLCPEPCTTCEMLESLCLGLCTTCEMLESLCLGLCTTCEMPESLCLGLCTTCEMPESLCLGLCTTCEMPESLCLGLCTFFKVSFRGLLHVPTESLNLFPPSS